LVYIQEGKQTSKNFARFYASQIVALKFEPCKNRSRFDEKQNN